MECGEAWAQPPTATASWKLQRSRTRWSAERISPASTAFITRSLQRSRTRWSAERSLSTAACIRSSNASTEPHSLECGEHNAANATVHHSPRFNGAALVGVRRAAGGKTAKSLDTLGFNGAALVGVRRGYAPGEVVPETGLASTEPHSLECGEPGWSPRGSPARRGFNGAALVGVRREAAKLLAQMQGWEASTEPHSLECGELYSSYGKHFSHLASTEPHSLECGERRRLQGRRAHHAASAEPHSLECGEFNAAFRQRPLRHASTEPHSLECGESGGEDEAVFDRLASTEPHSLECGEPEGGTEQGTPQVSFNGAALVGVRRAAWPRLGRKPPSCFNGAALVGVRRGIQLQGFKDYVLLLQRSRTRWSAESLMSFACTRHKARLQRSRTRWSAESTFEALSKLLPAVASTEPHSLECGELYPAKQSKPGDEASTEPHSLECGEGPSGQRSRRGCNRFNGAALVGVRRALWYDFGHAH